MQAWLFSNAFNNMYSYGQLLGAPQLTPASPTSLPTGPHASAAVPPSTLTTGPPPIATGSSPPCTAPASSAPLATSSSSAPPSSTAPSASAPASSSSGAGPSLSPAGQDPFGLFPPVPPGMSSTPQEARPVSTIRRLLNEAENAFSQNLGVPLSPTSGAVPLTPGLVPTPAAASSTPPTTATPLTPGGVPMTPGLTPGAGQQQPQQHQPGASAQPPLPKKLPYGATAYGKPGALTTTNAVTIAPGTYALRGYVRAKPAEVVPRTPAGRPSEDGPRGEVVGGAPAPPPPVSVRPARGRASQQGPPVAAQASSQDVIDLEVEPRCGTCHPEYFNEVLQKGGYDPVLVRCGMGRAWRKYSCNWCWNNQFKGQPFETTVYDEWVRRRDVWNSSEGLKNAIKWPDLPDTPVPGPLPLEQAARREGVWTRALSRKWFFVRCVWFIVRLQRNRRWRKAVEQTRHLINVRFHTLQMVGVSNFSNALIATRGLTDSLHEMVALWQEVPAGSEHRRKRPISQGDIQPPPATSSKAPGATASSSRRVTLTESGGAAGSNTVTEGSVVLRPAPLNVFGGTSDP